MTRFLVVFCLIAGLGLTGCARSLRVDPGPEEFAILPGKPLVEPADYAELPQPGGPSRAEVNPFAEAYRALGGSGSGPVRLLGSSQGVTTAGGGGWLARLFGRDRPADVLDAGAEAARLSGLGVPVPAR